MAFKTTAKTRSILNQIQKNPSVAIDVEGVDLLITSSIIFERLKWDSGATWDSGLTWDGLVRKEDAKGYINLRESTNSITQQIYPDKEGSSSITSVQLTIIDKNREISEAFALNAITEILGKKVALKLGFVRAAYPEDFMPIMNGVIVDYSYQGGAIMMTISHADTLRRQAILSEYNSQLTSPINDTTTTIPLADTSELLPSTDALTSYIKIGDEIMEVVSVDSAIQLTVVRGSLNTIETSHDNDADAKSIYRLTGQPLDLAQKIMQSDGDQSFFDSDIEIVSFEFVSPTQSIDNAIIFNDYDIEENTGLIEGDVIEIDTYGQFTVEGFGKLDNGNSYIIVEEDLSEETDVTESWRFRSKYNVLNFGLGMLPFEVDNQEFESIKTTFSPNFTELDFKIEDGIDDARDFINKELYFVSGCYGIPRNARSSVKFLSPPLTIEQLPTINETNVTNMVKLKPMRSVNKFYYNDILYAFNKSVLDGEFKSFSRFINQDSVDRFGVGSKQLRIESSGLIRSNVTDLILDRLAGRFLDRYRQAATLIKGVKLPFKSGFNLQVGDVVVFGGEGTKLVDFETGKRNLPVAKYEVVNQKIDLKGEISIDLLSTNFAIDGTFGVFSPASKLKSGSTTTKLILEEIGNLEEFEVERQKWEALVGLEIRVRTEDYGYDETTTFSSLDVQNQNAITVEALPSTPPVGAFVELADYPEHPAFGTDDIADTMKIKYTFTMNQDEIVSVADSQNFDVNSPGDFFVGQKITVHSDDFSRDNLESTISNISGSTITLEDPLDFTPQTGDKVESKSFQDLDGYLFL